MTIYCSFVMQHVSLRAFCNILWLSWMSWQSLTVQMYLHKNVLVKGQRFRSGMLLLFGMQSDRSLFLSSPSSLLPLWLAYRQDCPSPFSISRSPLFYSLILLLRWPEYRNVFWERSSRGIVSSHPEKPDAIPNSFSRAFFSALMSSFPAAFSWRMLSLDFFSSSPTVIPPTIS